MQKNNIRLRLKPGFFLLCAVFILIFPLKWVLAWVISMSVHELFHYIVLRLFNIRIYGIFPGLNGVIMKTESMPTYVEILSALAGPIGGLTLLLFTRWVPCTAVCAVVQSAFNLLPLYPLDGGRALMGILQMAFSDHGLKIYVIIKWLVIATLLLCAVASTYLGVGILPIIAVTFIIIKSSCKHG